MDAIKGVATVINNDQYSEPIASDDRWDEELHAEPQEYHPITKIELDRIRTGCYYPESAGCDGCYYPESSGCDGCEMEEEDIGCKFIMNDLFDEVCSRPLPAPTADAALDVCLDAIQKCKRYPSDLGDMVLESEIESTLRAKARQGGRE